MGVAIPTLYKQYTELCEPGGVKFLDFGVDADFAGCVDGLVLVDIDKLKQKSESVILKRVNIKVSLMPIKMRLEGN